MLIFQSCQDYQLFQEPQSQSQMRQTVYRISPLTKAIHLHTKHKKGPPTSFEDVQQSPFVPGEQTTVIFTLKYKSTVKLM